MYTLSKGKYISVDSEVTLHYTQRYGWVELTLLWLRSFQQLCYNRITLSQILIASDSDKKYSALVSSYAFFSEIVHYVQIILRLKE